MSIYGDIARFTLGTFINQSRRTTIKKDCKRVSYEVIDQYSQKYIRKIGNRYIYDYQVFDVTALEKIYLLSLNGTKQTFKPFYDSGYSISVYCDVYFNQYKYYPQSVIELTLTFVDIDTNPDITAITEWINIVKLGEEIIVFDGEVVTFTSDYDANSWLLQESLCSDSIYPKMTYLTNDYTFSSCPMEYEQKNIIDSEEVSITGRLHRRYVLDSAGTVQQENIFKIALYNIEYTDYTTLREFDRQVIKFYPIASDTVSYFNANFSIEWLLDTFDYAEIEIEPIGNLTTD